MYKHILIPTDGSNLSKMAIRCGMLHAKNSAATVVGVHVIPTPKADQLEAWAHHDKHYGDKRAALFEKFGSEYLAYLANSALAEDVPCITKLIKGDAPYLAIVKLAEEQRCDLILMASHGWRDDVAQQLGSETMKVLTHSKIAVLVHKPSPLERELFHLEAPKDISYAG